MPTIYPSAIARACSVLDESPAFKDLPDGYLRVVIRIVKKIRLSCPKSPIFASRGTIAQESGKSVETVGRAVKWLEDRNLIQRAQKARAGLRGSSSPITPTDGLLEALALADQAPQEAKENQASPVSQDASKSIPLKQSKERQPDRPAPFVKIDGCALPSELAWLVTRNAMKATGVLSLMKLASSKKQRLSDVVQASKKYLEGLTDRGLFAYLRKLVMQDKDYRAVVQVEAQQHQAANDKERVTRKSVELEGRAYRTRDGKVQVFVKAKGFLQQIANGISGYRPMDVGFLDAIDEGRLVPMVMAS